MDKIRIHNLKIHANHGVHEFEKINGQIFEIDVEMHADIKSSMETDDIVDTIDYDMVVKSIKKIFTKKNYNLVETVGKRICDYLLKEYPVEKIILRIRKPDAPIKADFDSVELEFERKK